MRRFIRIASIMCVLVWLFLVGCHSERAGETAVSSNPTANGEFTENASDAPLDPDRLYAVPDLSQVASTGRPQFLNAFANW
jgi:hypothetical protein